MSWPATNALDQQPWFRPWVDALILLIVCAILFAPGVFGERPLSVHEGRIPELAREMVIGESEWILPQSGGRPWLERPPLPHWLTAISMKVFSDTTSLWVVRLPAALAALFICMVSAWIMSRLFDRQLGLACGVVLATSYELYQYATLAEDDIYLAAVATACVACFVKLSWGSSPLPADQPAMSIRQTLRSALGNRPIWTWLFFALLGLTNLAKGPLVGALTIIGALGFYLLWSRDARRISQFVWVWGWLLFTLLTIAWPAWALHRYPDVWDNWRFDYLGQADGASTAAQQWDEPRWYYLMMLPLALAPWTWATIIGFVSTARKSWNKPNGPERFLWCWACVGVVLLSIPARKHHHYLVPLIAPFAMLATLGLRQTAEWLFDLTVKFHGFSRWAPPVVTAIAGVIALLFAGRRIPQIADANAFLITAWLVCVVLYCVGIQYRKQSYLLASVVVGVMVVAGWIQLRIAGRSPTTMAQLALADSATPLVGKDCVFINADVSSLNFFRLQFSVPFRSKLIHNLSYLRDRDLDQRQYWVMTPLRDQEKLRRIGAVAIVLPADQPPSTIDPNQVTLFRVTPDPMLQRFDRPLKIGVLQAMSRRPGPWCGEDWIDLEGRAPRSDP